ncbi:MAG: branched-chain amino acid ABC transporter ATP-binding protein [Chloroflexi bacterium RBG_19FT_COMBO_47_9]|nr:MAG: branched-chain amino acid ABC transporter ATP-binding protein [Chloroflexi bacterium RBG_19FT_COMBO_47_9]
MLKVEKVDFYYGEVQVLTNVSIHVEPGECVAIFGPNGHGKSTLLKVICGLYKPAAGEIYYGGQLISQMPTQAIVDLGLVYIPEDRNLFPEMTVIENLRVGAYAKHARPYLNKNLEFVYHLFPKLKTLNNRLASGLSGGEARMLAIGRGLMSNPHFLAIDEPSFGLAPNLRVDVFKAIEEIRQRGASVLLVEQSTTIASDYAHRIYAIEDGNIVFEGSKEEAYNNEEIRKIFLGI